MRARRAVAKSTSITSPIGGLNARDSLAAMPPQDAVVLDNFFCTPTTVDLRKGYTQWVTGLPGDVESLMPYSSATKQAMFCASATSFYDVTSSGAVGAAVRTGLTNARWQWANMGTAGGQFLLNVNGADKLRGYDGTNWWTDGDGAHDITGLDTSRCIHINSFKNRVYLVEVSSFRVWYLPLNSISGAANSFDLSPLFTLGGYLMAMATWTIDNAAGINEYAVFLSSEGQIAVYQGYDPSTSGSWSLVAVFRIGRPIGRRCFEKLGSDLIVICADGFMPLSKAMLTDRSQLQEALSSKILNLVNTDVARYASHFGWQPILYPIGNKFIVNVPQSANDTQYQYVQNTITGSWSRFTGWNANVFALLEDDLWFGGNLGTAPNSGYVAKCDRGTSDGGTTIFGEVQAAFQYFGSPGLLKRFTMVRPIFSTAGTATPVIGLDVDFSSNVPTGTASFSGSSGVPWNTTLWNTTPWGSVTQIQKNWQGVNGVGYSATIHMKVASNSATVSWMSVDYIFEPGAQL